MKKKSAVGYTLTMDLYGCKPGACDDFDLCYKFINEALLLLESENSGHPYIIFTDSDAFPDKAGLSGCGSCYFSDATIHTLSVKNFISADFYSDKPLDAASLKNLANKFFSPKAVESKMIIRGEGIDQSRVSMGKARKPFGYDLLIDIHGCNPAACRDIKSCYVFLDKLVGFIKMTKQSPPYVVLTERDGRKSISGWVPLVESGIRLRTSFEDNFISLDVYSCKEFDPFEVLKFIRQYFGAFTVFEARLILRGEDYYS